MAADLLRAQGKRREALAAFDDAQRTGDPWLARYGHALVELELGEFAQAQAELETCLARRGQAALVFDDAPTFRYVPEVTYYLARALEGQGNDSEAKKNYASFLAAQPDAEHTARIDDARRRLGLR